MSKPASKFRSLYIALSLILIGSFGAWWIQTGSNSVSVTGFTLPTSSDQWITADLYRPKNATSENKIPLVVICPGYERSKEAMGSYVTELVRRDIAVVVIDPYSQGASSASREKRSASLEGYGLVPMIEYIWNSSNFDFVDKTRIGAAGYSAGGNATLQTASLFGGKSAKKPKSKKSGTAHPATSAAVVAPEVIKSKPKLAAAFVGGYVLTLTPEVLSSIHSNIAVDYADHDEGAYRTELGTADLRKAPEALRFVNAVLSPEETVTEVEIGKAYGNVNKQTLRIVYNTGPMIHPLLPYDTVAVSHLISFFSTAFNLTTTIAVTNQVWYLKEICTLIALIGGLWLLLPITKLLLKLDLFKSLVHSIPAKLPRHGIKSYVRFWVTFIISACIAAWLLIRAIGLTSTLFPTASAGLQTWWFPERMNNAIMVWAFLNGLAGLTIFSINFFSTTKAGERHKKAEGLHTSVKELVKTLFLALSVAASFYVVLFIVYGIFHTDYRFVFTAAPAAFPVKILVVALEYIPFFLVFYLSNSIRVNITSRFEGQKEWVSRLLMGLANSVGLFTILAIQYSHLASSGRVFWTTEWIHIDLLFGITPMMFILPYFNRSFFLLTGRVYLGACITCFVFIMMMLTSNVCYIPL